MTWTPAQLPGIVAWFVADDLTGADGSTVASWTDRIGSMTVSQATAGQQPTLHTGANGIAGHNQVVFASASTTTLSAPVGALPAGGAFAVAAMQKRAATNGFQRMLTVTTSGSNVGYGVGTADGAQLVTTFGVSDFTSGYHLNGAEIDMAYWDYDGSSTSQMNKNNYYPPSSVSGGAAIAGSTTFTIGGKPGATEYWDGGISEIIVCSQVISTADRFTLAKYWQDNYGVLTDTPYHAPNFVATPSADTTGTCVECSVLDFGVTSFNGHRFWNGFVPYPSGPSSENPSINCSDDGNTWVTPTGVTNPIVPYPGGGSAGNNSDPGLFYNAADSKLYLFYQLENTTPVSAGGVYVTSSTDGVTWSTPVQVIAATANDSDQEPKCFYDSASGAWWLYTQNGVGSINRYVSTTGPTSGYGSKTLCTFADLPASSGGGIWHTGNFIKVGPQYVFAGSDVNTTRNMWLAASSDGLTWHFNQHPILIAAPLNWDNGSLYRLTLTPADNGTDLWGWYTDDGNNKYQMSQRISIPLTELPATPSAGPTLAAVGGTLSAIGGTLTGRA